MRSFWISCSRFTICVDTDEQGIITSAAPLARKFLGQPIDNLLRWADRFRDGLDVCEIQHPQSRKDSQ